MEMEEVSRDDEKVTYRFTFHYRLVSSNPNGHVAITNVMPNGSSVTNIDAGAMLAGALIGALGS